MSEQTTRLRKYWYPENVVRDRRQYAIDDQEAAMKAAWICVQILEIKSVHICKMEISTRRGVDEALPTKLCITLSITGGMIGGIAELITDIKGWSIRYSQFSVPSNGLWLSVGADFIPNEADTPTAEQTIEFMEKLMWFYNLIKHPILTCNCGGWMSFQPYQKGERGTNYGRAYCKTCHKYTTINSGNTTQNQRTSEE